MGLTYVLFILQRELERFASSVDVDGSGTLTFLELVPVIAGMLRTYPHYINVWTAM